MLRLWLVQFDSWKVQATRKRHQLVKVSQWDWDSVDVMSERQTSQTVAFAYHKYADRELMPSDSSALDVPSRHSGRRRFIPEITVIRTRESLAKSKTPFSYPNRSWPFFPVGECFWHEASLLVAVPRTYVCMYVCV